MKRNYGIAILLLLIIILGYWYFSKPNLSEKKIGESGEYFISSSTPEINPAFFEFAENDSILNIIKSGGIKIASINSKDLPKKEGTSSRFNWVRELPSHRGILFSSLYPLEQNTYYFGIADILGRHAKILEDTKNINFQDTSFSPNGGYFAYRTSNLLNGCEQRGELTIYDLQNMNIIQIPSITNGVVLNYHWTGDETIDLIFKSITCSNNEPRVTEENYTWNIKDGSLQKTNALKS